MSSLQPAFALSHFKVKETKKILVFVFLSDLKMLLLSFPSFFVTLSLSHSAKNSFVTIRVKLNREGN
jgi:hypothetical protein